MQLANIVLKLDKIGSCVQLKNVTPPQVMFLCADHHTNAGGDPVVKLDLLDEDAEVAPLKKVQEELEVMEESQRRLELVTNITDEVRELRATKLRRKMQVKIDEITRLKGVQALRTLSPSTERRRLTSIFGRTRIEKFFPGQIPQLPQNFQEARELGVQTEAPYERLATMSGPE